jgi:hypothetical protein
MSFYKANSWGRTRRPKNMSEDVPVNIQTATQVTTVAVGALADDLDGSNAGENGYVTENQRFLHIQIENDDTSENLSIFAYNYAFRSWSLLYIPVGGGTTAEATYVAATFASINGKKMITIPIQGIDRIAFVDDGSHDTNFKVRAACSTF